MRNLTIVEVELHELIERIEKEIAEIKQEVDNKIAYLTQRKNALEESLKTYAEMKGTEPIQTTKILTQKDVYGKTYREILRMIAERNNKLLIVRHAIKGMKELGVFGDAGNPDSIVYSTINRHPNEFHRVGKGLYKLNGQNIIKPSKSRNRGKPSGVKDAIKELKTQNPLMTKSEVLRNLIERHFDFKGKKSGNAVNMAWVSLGYSKEGKQQPLLT